MKPTWLLLPALALWGCTTAQPNGSTLADLAAVDPELQEVDVTQSLEHAMDGYRQFLTHTEVNEKTPEALRRLADLKIEKEFGTHVDAPPEGATAPGGDLPEEFSAEASRQAIATYQRILEEYPHYHRNDQVLYQMARAYGELGETEQAMDIMQRFVRDYPDSAYLDEVQFRRGEHFFVRKQYLEAEAAYGAIIARGQYSEYYELARYKLGWTLYKQDLYEQALHQYLALLDHKVTQGYDFDTAHSAEGAEEDKRVQDTFRVVSLAFSNLGGADMLNDFFAANGRRGYESRIYRNLAEFYVAKLRYNDAAEVYQSFVSRNPLHQVAPHFSMRISEVYAEGGFPLLVVESKKAFAQRFGLAADYWQHHDPGVMPDVLGYLKTNLQDLAQHYHALYQDEALAEEQTANYAEAHRWYQDFLESFPDAAQAPGLNYRLADLHLEHEAYALAASAYERTAYDYPTHEESASAGYAAVFAHREHLERAPEEDRAAAMRLTVDSSLRFAGTFPEHEQAAKVLGAATDDLYAMQAYDEAIAAGLTLINEHPNTEPELRRRAWVAVAHGYFELARYPEAEAGYLEVLQLTDPDQEGREDLVENLAAAIYQQGELARAAGDDAAAAEHFLRVGTLAPSSSVRPAAQYDAAVALVSLQVWGRAAEVLQDFRDRFADHELQNEVTKQLALVFREAQAHAAAADEYRRIGDAAEEPAQRRESLLMAAELYEKAGRVQDAISVYRDYVADFPEPLEENVEIRHQLAELLRPLDEPAYRDELRTIVELDRTAGVGRTDRIRYLAANAALVLAEPVFDYFADMSLVQPFDVSLADKQKRMNEALRTVEALVPYEVANVTSAATFYMAEVYRNFSQSLLDSERPKDLTGSALSDYEMTIEEEAYPFEERAIEIHAANVELMVSGTHNAWVEKSLAELRILLPARYDKRIASAGYVGAIDQHAYRSPLADQLVAESDGPGSEQENVAAEPASMEVSHAH